MEKKDQKATLHNVYNELLRMSFKGAEARQITAVLDAIGTVHDALTRELQTLETMSAIPEQGKLTIVKEQPTLKKRGRGRPAKQLPQTVNGEVSTEAASA